MRIQDTLRQVSKIGKMLDFYSQFNPSPLSIKQFLDFGKFNKNLKKRLVPNFYFNQSQ